MRRSTASVPDLVERARSGDARAVARLISLVEDASPLLYRLSALYSFVRQSLEGKAKESLSFSEDQAGAEGFTSHKCMSCYHYH